MPRHWPTIPALLLVLPLALAMAAAAQAPVTQTPAPATPIALVRLDADSGLSLDGSLTLTGSRAAIASSGSVTAGSRTARLTLPGRGHLSLCATTRATLTLDPAHPTADHSGLMVSLDHGAVETDFRTGQVSDVILTPDFRILISGPGQSTVQVRLADHGDTCVDNHGKHPPYVTVTSLFTGQAYRVQPNQRVLFQHGSVSEVVDNESESCGCPPESTRTLGNNAFPVAQSAGLAPLPAPPPNATQPGIVHAQATAALSYNGTAASQPASTPTRSALSPAATSSTASSVASSAQATPQAPPRKPGVLRRIGHFFHRLFVAA